MKCHQIKPYQSVLSLCVIGSFFLSAVSIANAEQKKIKLPQPGFLREILAPLSAQEKATIKLAACKRFADSMDSKPHARKWAIHRLKPKDRFETQSKTKTEGKSAFAIYLNQDDSSLPGSKKDPDYHKHELRIANKKRCHFGQDIWYSFSFHITGDFPRTGSTRWVIGQWKEETDGSPFLVQRFDNGVFHITIQRNEDRVLIATAKGDIDAKSIFLSQKFKNKLKEKSLLTPTAPQFAAAIKDFGPQALNLKAYKKAITDQDLKQFPFIADPKSFSKIEGLKFDISDQPFLPNPSNGWVHMRYRIRGDRKGNGLIEVWANNVKITRVTGKIGNDKFDGPTQYFKIGHYRDVDTTFKKSTLYFDKFKRSLKQSDVD